jgi:hypothetical protein
MKIILDMHALTIRANFNMRSMEKYSNNHNWTNYWTNLAAIVALLAISLTACSKSSDDGKIFVAEKLESLKPNWNTNKFFEDVDPRINKNIIDKAFKEYAGTLGPIEDIGTIKAGQFNTSVGIGVANCEGTYFTTLTCKNGAAKTTVIAEHLNGKWLLKGFNLDSDLFKNLGKKESKDALTFSESFIKKWASNGFALEMLYQYTDPASTEKLHKNELAIKLMCKTMQMMGKLKKLSDAKLQQVSPAEHGFAFTTVTGADFEHTHADILLQVVKNDGQWKVSSLDVHSRNP